ncbi:MAG: hypothetical protein RIS70_4220, partial [Planctomycetota bacterium]
WLLEFGALERPGPANILRLRNAVGTPEANLLLEIVEARRQARPKFQRAGELFFTRKSAEQATDERIAAWKATRFRGRTNVVDLGCGAGGDLLGLATELPAVGVECDPTLAHFAATNARILTRDATVQMLSAETIELQSFAAWHCDPDRRSEGRRTSRIEFSTPDLATLERWRTLQPQAAIKLAPSAELPENWDSAEREWIASRGECRQQVAWFGGLTDRPGWKTATVVDAVGGVATFSAPSHADSTARVDMLSAPAPLLFEPSPAVIAARLCRALSHACELHFATPDGHWLTGHHDPRCGLLQGFAVLERMPFDRKRVAAALKQHGAGIVEVKTRSQGLDPAKLQRELTGAGAAPLSLIIFRNGSGDRGSLQAVIASRISGRISG